MAERHMQVEGPCSVGNGRIILNMYSNVLIKSERAPGHQNKYSLA